MNGPSLKLFSATRPEMNPMIVIEIIKA